MKTAKLVLQNGRDVVIGLEDKEDGWLTSKIMASISKIERPLLYEQENGTVLKTGQKINIKTERISTWSIADMDVKGSE